LETASPVRQPWCDLVWGPSAAAQAAAAGDIIAIVDTLSFSTATAAAAAAGGLIYPCRSYDDAVAMAARVKASPAVRRSDVPARGRFSLSPLTYRGLQPGERVVLPSVNGGVCTRAAVSGGHIVLGALVNAAAVAAAVGELRRGKPTCGVTMVACGEREEGAPDLPIRFAVEDMLGAGAIIAGLDCHKSPSARAAEAAFIHLRDHLEWALGESVSGRELIAQGFGGDVHFAAQLNEIEAAPILRGDHYELFRPSGPAGIGDRERAREGRS